LRRQHHRLKPRIAAEFAVKLPGDQADARARQEQQGKHDQQAAFETAAAAPRRRLLVLRFDHVSLKACLRPLPPADICH